MAYKKQVGRPLKFRSVVELQKQIDAWYAQRMAENKPITMTSLALFLDCDRETLLNYEERPEFSSTLKRAKLFCHEYAESQLFSGKNATGSIFSLKNNFGWKDEHITQNVNEGKTIEPENKEKLDKLLIKSSFVVVEESKP